MSVFSRFFKKEKQVTRTFEIDISLYEKLEHLSSKVYDASINKLVNACLESFAENPNIAIYSRPKNEVGVSRSFTLKEEVLNVLFDLRDEYNISLNRLVNIAIRNALIEEGVIKNKK